MDIKETYAKKLFSKFPEIETLAVENWVTYHLVGYFFKKYKDYYGCDYAFSYSKPQVSKCKEVFTINRIKAMISGDPKTVKEYIDYVFEKKVSHSKRKLTSITFLIAENTMKDFRLEKLLQPDRIHDKIDRSTAIPDSWKEYFDNKQIPVQTYGQLIFYIEATKNEEVMDLVNYDQLKGKII
jgi:hypothetical protein